MGNKKEEAPELTEANVKKKRLCRVDEEELVNDLVHEIKESIGKYLEDYEPVGFSFSGHENEYEITLRIKKKRYFKIKVDFSFIDLK